MFFRLSLCSRLQMAVGFQGKHTHHKLVKQAVNRGPGRAGQLCKEARQVLIQILMVRRIPDMYMLASSTSNSLSLCI